MNTDIYHHNNITANLELTYRALIYLRLYDSIAKQIKQQTAHRRFAGSKPGRDCKSPKN